MTVVARKDSRSLATMPSKKGLRCMSYEDTLREMEAFLAGNIDNPQSAQDAYADITEPMSSSAIRLPDPEDPDATESSSSFGDTTSRSDNISGSSDAEVESEFRLDTGLGSMLDGYSSAFQIGKKKLTDHWRKFIRPLMWRCKWTELRVKELESQALKYSRELEANDQTKMLKLHQYNSDFCSKAIPFFNNSKKRKPMKRRKRKLVENVTDISSFTSHHQLFSYLEGKKDLDVTLTAHDAGTDFSRNDEFGVNYDWLKDGEDSFEQILRQIDTVQSQVQTLRTHLDMVMLQNGVKFSSSENLSLLEAYDAQTSADQSPVFSVGNGDAMSIGDMYVASEHLPDFELGDLVLPESLVSGYGEGIQIPDITESTDGLLSAADVTIHQQQMMESGENTLEDAIMMQNQVLHNGHVLNRVIDQCFGAFEAPENKEQRINRLVAEPLILDAVSQDKSSLKSCLTSEIQIPKNKRTRVERKTNGGWNIRSGEPASS